MKEFQGVLEGEPYVVTFCGICHSGLVPLIDDKLYHFESTSYESTLYKQFQRK